MKGHVLITGASGFVGTHLVARLAQAGWQVRAASRGARRMCEAPGIACVPLPDLDGPVDWLPLLAGISHVVHLAGIAHATAAISEATYRRVNGEAVGALAAAARSAEVERVVLVSSVRAQSGPVAPAPLTEADEPTPTDAYGASKLLGERRLAAELAGSQTQYVILRPVVVYGPGAKANMRALARLARTPLPVPVGKLAGRRSILSLANLASAVEHALTSPAVAGGTYLVADPQPVTLPEMISAMRAGLGRRARIIPVPSRVIGTVARAARRRAAWERLVGDLVVETGALEATGWRPVNLPEAGLYRWMLAERTESDTPARSKRERRASS